MSWEKSDLIIWCVKDKVPDTAKQQSFRCTNVKWTIWTKTWTLRALTLNVWMKGSLSFNVLCWVSISILSLLLPSTLSTGSICFHSHHQSLQSPISFRVPQVSSHFLLLHSHYQCSLESSKYVTSHLKISYPYLHVGNLSSKGELITVAWQLV